MLLEVIDTAPMDTGLVTVDAAAMAKEMRRRATSRCRIYRYEQAELKPIRTRLAGNANF